jgi:hypothetical protein
MRATTQLVSPSFEGPVSQRFWIGVREDCLKINTLQSFGRTPSSSTTANLTMRLPPTLRARRSRIHARETIELDTSHASFATRPTQVLELITKAAVAV